MSLTSLNTAAAANAGRAMPVLHPTDRTPLVDAKKKAVTIDLLGRDSDAFIKAENEARSRAVDQMTKGVKFSAAAADHQACEALARVTTGWSGIPTGWIDGTDNEEPIAFSHENALSLYANPGVRWLRDQVDEFVGARANFLKAAPKG